MVDQFDLFDYVGKWLFMGRVKSVSFVVRRNVVLESVCFRELVYFCIEDSVFNFLDLPNQLLQYFKDRKLSPHDKIIYNLKAEIFQLMITIIILQHYTLKV